MRVLIFGTTYCKVTADFDLLLKWEKLHAILNPRCDRLVVDSDSYYFPTTRLRADTIVIQFGDNVGHLARGGRDGWGRAFCDGLRYAIESDYDYVAHVEGDSLCKLDIMKQCEAMRTLGIGAAGVPVVGTTREEFNWIETGLMIFSVPYLKANNIIRDYNWEDGAGKKYPKTPEWHLNKIPHLYRDMPWMNLRDDVKRATPETVKQYDWISHAWPEVYDAFMEEALSAVAA